MKHLSLFKTMALACGTLLAAAVFSSCSSTVSPGKAATQLADGAAVTIFSHNDVNHPNNRNCREAGPIPERATRALQAWLRNSTVKNFAYAYPQYYVAMQDPRTGRQSAWGICSDGQGNLVGVLIPRAGVMAWDLPPVGNYRMYVCETENRKVLSDAVMNTLADAGYDSFRIESRKSMGLTQQRYLISKPLSDAAQKRYEELKRQEELMQQTSAERKAAAAPAPAPADSEEESSSDEEESSEDEESSDEDEESEDEEVEDDGFDELGF